MRSIIPLYAWTIFTYLRSALTDIGKCRAARREDGADFPATASCGGALIRVNPGARPALRVPAAWGEGTAFGPGADWQVLAAAVQIAAVPQPMPSQSFRLDSEAPKTCRRHRFFRFVRGWHSILERYSFATKNKALLSLQQIPHSVEMGHGVGDRIGFAGASSNCGCATAGGRSGSLGRMAGALCWVRCSGGLFRHGQNRASYQAAALARSCGTACACCSYRCSGAAHPNRSGDARPVGRGPARSRKKRAGRRSGPRAEFH